MTATPYISVTDTSTSKTSEPTTRYDNGHPNSPWRRIAIIPIWVVQLGFLAVNAVVAGMLIGITESGSVPGQNAIQPYMPSPYSGPSKLTVYRWIVVNIIFASIALVLTCVEVLMFVHHELTPNMFLLSTVVKIVMGLIPIAFQIYVTRTSWVHISPNGVYLATGFGFSIIE